MNAVGQVILHPGRAGADSKLSGWRGACVPSGTAHHARCSPGTLLGPPVLARSFERAHQVMVSTHDSSRVSDVEVLTLYSDEKVANRDIRVWHFVIENGY